MDGREMLSQGGFNTGCRGAHCERYGFLQQHPFRQMLISERKRAERSKRPFVLVLISLTGLKLRASRCNGEVHNLIKMIHEGVRETDIAGWYEHLRVMGIIFTETQGKDTQSLSEKVEQILSSAGTQLEIKSFAFPFDQINLEEQELLGFYQHNSFSWGKIVTAAGKRTIDIIVSFTLLLVLLPLFALIGILIKVGSPGPVFFKQQRIGMGGRIFTFYKFRSMHVNNDDTIHRQYVTKLIHGEVDESGGVYKITNDPRITPLGRFLRRTSLDELPQFFNVLRGDMSLVGPRPPIPYEIESYKTWHLRRFMECKPGITGLWQVEGRSRTTFDGMVRMDIRYSKALSIYQDFKLLFKTPAVLLFAKGAY